MSVEEAKAQYLFLKEKGDLGVLFPGLSGKWEKDKRLFVQQYELNNEFVKEGLLDLDVDLDGDDTY